VYCSATGHCQQYKITERRTKKLWRIRDAGNIRSEFNQIRVAGSIRSEFNQIRVAGNIRSEFNQICVSGNIRSEFNQIRVAGSIRSEFNQIRSYTTDFLRSPQFQISQKSVQ